MKFNRMFLLAAALLAAALALPQAVYAQKAALVQNVDEPARTPYQHAIIFNQGQSTCSQFVCLVVFPAVPAGKRLEVNYVSALFGAPNGSATVSVKPDSSFFTLGVYLPLPQTYGFGTYVGGSPVTLFVDAGNNPTVALGGLNVNLSSTSAQVAIVGHLVTLP